MATGGGFRCLRYVLDEQNLALTYIVIPLLSQSTKKDNWLDEFKCDYCWYVNLVHREKKLTQFITRDDWSDAI